MSLPSPRTLDPGEAFFTLSDRISSMNFAVLAERSATLDSTRLRTALDRVQLENQLLQVCIDWNPALGLRFVAAPDQRITLHCQDVPALHWQCAVEQELSLPFAAQTAPLLRCRYLSLCDQQGQATGHSVLVLCFHHAVTDGRGAIALLQRLLSLIADHEVCAPAAPTHQASMQQLLPSCYRWAEQPLAARALRSTLLADYRRHGAPIALPWQDAAAPGSTPRILRHALPPDQTLALTRAARAHHTTVHGALCAAQLLAQAHVLNSTTPSTLLLSCPVDMRPYLQPAPATLPLGLHVSIVSATYPVAAQTSLWELAGNITRQTRVQIERGEGHLFYHLYGLDGAPVLPDRLPEFSAKLRGSLHNTMVSNVGIVPELSHDPALQAISFALCPMPYQSLFTAASSYRGQLLLNIGFDAVHTPEPQALALVQAMLQALRDAAMMPA